MVERMASMSPQEIAALKARELRAVSSAAYRCARVSASDGLRLATDEEILLAVAEGIAEANAHHALRTAPPRSFAPVKVEPAAGSALAALLRAAGQEAA